MGISRQRQLAGQALAELELAENRMFMNQIEGFRASVDESVLTREQAVRIVMKLNLKVKARALVKHDRILCEDKRGDWYL